ncbi:hypothetical protein BYT27DRAFT_7085987 [Phlegmacium glaucopus]|nr:hypothetical protein BYT27DRAFT_7085987 [Phlegmacium glaucopus]
MNVLIYSGPDIIQTSLNHALTSLKAILLPHYTIQPVTQHILTTQPWQKSCALLVLPQTRGSFVNVANKHIKNFVEAGGNCLLMGSRATVTSRSIGGSLGLGSGSLSWGGAEEETPALPLKFFDKLNNRYISIDGDNIAEDALPRYVSLRSLDGILVKGIYDASTAPTSQFNGVQGTSITARYASDNDEEGAVACLSLDVNDGRLVLWIPNIEYPVNQAAIVSTIGQSTIKSSTQGTDEFEILRLKLLRRSLVQFGLHLPSENERGQTFSRPLPQFLTSTPQKSALVSQVMDAISALQPGSQLSVFKDANDEFHFHLLQESSELVELARAKSGSEESSDPATWQPKHVVVCLDRSVPPPELTPLFDLRIYYEVLSATYEKNGLVGTAEPWRMGEVLLYGEAVTSSYAKRTLLPASYRNPQLLSKLPTPFVSLASHQLAGRGRGSNVWLSPSGCLQFSVLLRVSLSNFPASKLVFIQYLFALAVVEACRTEFVLGDKAGGRVRLKWPNDLYAVVGSDEEANAENVRKIGGVLVNTSFSSGSVDIVIGCGLNVLNIPPMTSLVQLPGAAHANISIERTAASIISKFASMWSTFVQERGSFGPFMDLYLKRWIHSDQLVTLTTTIPHRQVRIIGITEDHGLLRTIPERNGLGRYASTVEYIDLQPDGNSFDLMANLIKSKP